MISFDLGSGRSRAATSCPARTDNHRPTVLMLVVKMDRREKSKPATKVGNRRGRQPPYRTGPVHTLDFAGETTGVAPTIRNQSAVRREYQVRRWRFLQIAQGRDRQEKGACLNRATFREDPGRARGRQKITGRPLDPFSVLFWPLCKPQNSTRGIVKVPRRGDPSCAFFSACTSTPAVSL